MSVKTQKNHHKKEIKYIILRKMRNEPLERKLAQFLINSEYLVSELIQECNDLEELADGLELENYELRVKLEELKNK
jgi:hypothetical protein